MRLQKFIAAAGVCSRREAEERIRQGRVTLNGQVATLGDCTEEECDIVCVDGHLVCGTKEHTYVLLNKPRGYITSMHDEKGRKTVAELTADVGVRVFPVGRLDCMSEGLLIMTDDGDIANRLAHPSHQVNKTYRVRVFGSDFSRAAELMRGGVTYEEISYLPAGVKVLREENDRAVMDITVHEGKNHEVRNICAAASLKVTRLTRIRQGDIRLGNLPSGKWRFLTDEEIHFLQNLS